jgi:hypothetical protein
VAPPIDGKPVLLKNLKDVLVFQVQDRYAIKTQKLPSADKKLHCQYQ